MTVLNKQFFDFRTLLSRSISYISSLITIAIVFFSIEFVIEKFIYNNDEVVDIISAVGGAFAFYFFKSFFDRVTDKVFFRKEYDYAAAIHEIGPLLNTTIDLKFLLNGIYAFLARTIRTERIIFIFDEASSPICFHGGNSATIDSFSEQIYYDLINRFFLDFKQAIFIHELLSSENHKELCSIARSLNIVGIVPLALKEEARAVMLVGPRLSGRLFRKKDIALINALAQQAGMAIRNARLYEEVRQYNNILEVRVTERTEKIRLMYESQSKFLTEISHELQTPIAILRGNIEALQDGTRQERERSLRIIKTTVDDMSRLISNLLESAKLKFSKNIFYKKEVDVGILLQEIYEDYFILAENKGVNLSVASEDLWVCVDRNKLKEVILNLISNALKHTPRGGIISLTAKKKDGTVMITIEDTGSGISPEDLPNIFERFYTIEDAGYARKGNTGIGLNICRQIIETHGGTIWAESDVGKGSSFIIQLPILL